MVGWFCALRVGGVMWFCILELRFRIWWIVVKSVLGCGFDLGVFSGVC